MVGGRWGSWWIGRGKDSRTIYAYVQPIVEARYSFSVCAWGTLRPKKAGYPPSEFL